MANYIIDGTLLTNIAAAIRTQKDVSTQYTPAQMATAITGLQAEVAGTTNTIEIAVNASIPRGSSKTVIAQDSGGNTLDLSKAAIVSMSFNASSGVFISAINPENNTITISVPSDSSHTDQVTVWAVTLGYRGLTIY